MTYQLDNLYINTGLVYLVPACTTKCNALDPLSGAAPGNFGVLSKTPTKQPLTNHNVQVQNHRWITKTSMQMHM